MYFSSFSSYTSYVYGEDTELLFLKNVGDTQIREFKNAILDYPLHSNGLIDAPKDLSDIVESTIGAIFLDSGSSLDTTWKVISFLQYLSLVNDLL